MEVYSEMLIRIGMGWSQSSAASAPPNQPAMIEAQPTSKPRTATKLASQCSVLVDRSCRVDHQSHVGWDRFLSLSITSPSSSKHYYAPVPRLVEI